MAVLVHNIVRPRARLAMRLWRLPSRLDAILAVSRAQTDFLAKCAGRDRARLVPILDQTDVQFFTPGPAKRDGRPIVMSVGLEQRDYRTLAAATADLAVDVCISGFSRNAKAMRDSFPETMPANMQRSFYEWTDLLQLYRDCAVVVVSVFPNSYAAGIQAMLEATACGRPVIVTRTDGLVDYIDRPDLITVVPTGDPEALRQAILDKVNNPQAASRQAQAARSFYLPKIASERYVQDIANVMRDLAETHEGA